MPGLTSPEIAAFLRGDALRAKVARATCSARTVSTSTNAATSSCQRSTQSGRWARTLRAPSSSGFGQGWVRTLPSSRFAWKVRAEAVDFDRAVAGDDVRQLSAGVNFRPSEDTVLKLDYVRGRARDRFGVPADQARLLFSLATYF